MYNDWIPVKPDEFPERTLPISWHIGRKNCVPDEINFNPTTEFNGGFVPLGTVKAWHKKGLVKDVGLYAYDMTLPEHHYCLDFLVIGYNTLSKPHWISATSTTFQAEGFMMAHDYILKLNIPIKRPDLPLHWSNEHVPPNMEI